MTQPRTTASRADSIRVRGDAVRGTHAYRTLRDLIVHGRIAPGTRVGEIELARRLGMSRTPIRSALQRLRQEGYIVVEGDGRLGRTFIAPLTREDARDVFSLLGAVEGVAARAAAEQDVSTRRGMIARMRRLNAELRAIAKRGVPDPERRYHNDAEFHGCYVSFAPPRIGALHEAIKPQAERYIRVYISLLVGTSIGEHEEIIDALGAADPDRAERAVAANWRNAADRLAKVIDQAGEKGSW